MTEDDAWAVTDSSPRLTAGRTANGHARAFPVVRVLEGEPPPSPAMLVDGLVLDLDVNVVAGPGGVGKSPLLMTTAVSVVLDMPVFGTLRVHRPGRVFLVLPEDGQAAARMMLDAIIVGNGLESHRRALTDGIVMLPDEIRLDLRRDGGRLAESVRDHEAVLTIVDPVGHAIGDMKEDANSEVEVLIDSLRRDVCRGAGTALVLTRHNRKPGKDGPTPTETTRHDLRGAAAWVDNARLAVGVSKRAGRVTITGLKANRIRADFRHELDLEIEADADNAAHWLSCTLKDANAGATSDSLTPGIGRSLNANETAVLSALDDRHEPDTRLSWSQWFKRSGVPNENTFKSIRTRMLDAQLAQAISTGRKTRSGSTEYNYAITPQGRSALATGWVSERPRGEGVSIG